MMRVRVCWKFVGNPVPKGLKGWHITGSDVVRSAKWRSPAGSATDPAAHKAGDLTDISCLEGYRRHHVDG